MGNGWISSEDISWLTLADLKRCHHYDNLVVPDQDEFESYEDIDKRWKAWDAEDHDTLEVHDGI